MNFMMTIVFLILPFTIYAQELVTVPKVSDINVAKKRFISDVSNLSKRLYGTGFKTAIAPMGGSKVTPLLELDLDQLVIVTDSYPGTPDEIKRQFSVKGYALKKVMEHALRSGSMSTSDVFEANISAQILARLKLEMNVSEVTLRYWTDSPEIQMRGYRSFEDRPFSPKDTPVATTFDFVSGNKIRQIVLISSYIQADDQGDKAGLPEFVEHYTPRQGFHWVYLSADDLGFFSANKNNGLSVANQHLLNILRIKGAVLLDYPTDSTYHTPQVSGGIRFMEGRRDLSEISDMKWLKTFRVERPGVFGHCHKIGDEVRVYQKIWAPKSSTSTRLDTLGQAGAEVIWKLQ